MSRRSLIARSAGPLVVLAVLGTAACGGSSATSSSSSSAASSSAASSPSASPAHSDLAAAVVTGAPGAAPKLTLPLPFSVQQTTTRVLTKGSGPSVLSGQAATVDYTAFNGATGKQYDTSIGKASASFLLNPQQTLPGLVKGIVGQTVGSRLLLAIPPADAYGSQGIASAGIGPTDTVLFIVDLKGAHNVPTRASGTPVAPKAGLPKVTLAANGKPTVTVPTGPPPAALVVQPLIEGTGAKVTKGQQITVNYTGVIWKTGKTFDSSWDRGQPASFGIGVGQVIPGWDQGLVGQPVGSQVLLVIPPADGYGTAGQPSAGISGTDTLVFVVDILDAG